MWELLQGEVLEGGWQNEDVKDALDLCLSCKACKTECPTNVDLATYKAEFLAHYYEGRSRPLHAYAFGMIDRWARIASHTPRLANALGRFPLTAGIANSLLHIRPERKLPEFATSTFRARVRRRQGRGPAGTKPRRSRAGSGAAKADVLLWADTFTNYFQPQIAEAAHQVLSDAGFSVKVLQRHVCCGRPLYDFGMLDKAKQYLTQTHGCAGRRNLPRARRSSYSNRAARAYSGMKPSNLMPDDPRTAKLKQQTMLLSEFLVTARARLHAGDRRQQKMLVHMHCHQRAIFNVKDEVAVLNATGGEVKVLDSGCCGMAGPFGFEKKSYAVSQTLGERVLLPAVRAAEPGTVIVTDGFSCREQIAQNTDRRAVHLAEVLAGRI